MIPSDTIDVGTLKENRIEIFGNGDEGMKKLTRRIFLNLNSTAALNFPTCDERRCRPPMNDFIFRFLQQQIRYWLKG